MPDVRGMTVEEATKELKKYDLGIDVVDKKPSNEYKKNLESTTSELIEENGRRAEDLYMFRKFWPGWIAKMIERVYQKSEESNEV